MSGEIRQCLLNTASVVAGATVTTAYASTTTFREVTTLFDPAKLKGIQSPTRRFILRDTFARRRDERNAAGQVTTYLAFFADLELTVAYIQGKDHREFNAVVAEDVDVLTYRLDRTDLYDGGTTFMSVRETQPVTRQLDVDANGVALVTFPITILYRPSF